MFTIAHVNRLFPEDLFQERCVNLVLDWRNYGYLIFLILRCTQFLQLIDAFKNFKKCIDMPVTRFEWFREEGLRWIDAAVSTMVRYTAHLHADKVCLVAVRLFCDLNSRLG
jgi:hypothetical protein